MTRDERLTPAKRDLLDRWRSGQVALEDRPIPPRDRGRPAPLSVQQQRFWLLEQLTPGTSAYQLTFAAWLRGPLDVSALALAVAELVRRHESLRTTFRAAAEGPVQVIEDEPRARLQVLDAPAPRRGRPGAVLPHHPGTPPPGGREIGGRDEAVRLLTTAAREPFDLERGPLARMQLVRLDYDLHLFAITVHHLVSDGWSLGVALTELRWLYERFASGERPDLPPPALQYADVAAWQRGWLEEGRWRAGLPWWRERLAGIEPLALPVVRARPASPSLRCHSRPLTLSAELSGRLRDLGRQEGATPFMTLLAGYVALVALETGQTAFAVGSPTANRPRAETFGVIGVFINSLVLRVDLSGEPTFRELVRRVRAVCLEALAHQDVPFEELVEDLRIGRDPGRSPLFQALFVLQNSPMPELGFGAARMEPVELASGSCMVDLEVHLWDREPEIGGRLNASADVFDGPTADRLAERLVAVLGLMAAQPDRRAGVEGG